MKSHVDPPARIAASFLARAMKPPVYLILLLVQWSCSDESPSSPSVAATIQLSESSLVFSSLDETKQLTAAVQDRSGGALSGAAISWTSSNPAVASVSSTGLVTALGNGSASVTAKSGAATASAQVTVQQIAVSLRISADSVRMSSLTDTLSLTASLMDAKGKAVSGEGVEWITSDASVAAVSSTGRITATGNGSAAVVARSGALLDTLTVRVQQVPAAIELSHRVHAFSAVGQTLDLSATVRDSARQAVVGAQPGWSSINGAVVSVTAAGSVIARGKGVSSIVATLAGVADTAVITVGDPLRLVVRQEIVHEFIDNTQVPTWTYGGKTNPGGPVGYFPEGYMIHDFWEDGRPDLMVPHHKGYATKIDTRFKPLFFRNVGGRLVEASAEVNVPAIAGVLRSARLNLPNDPFSGFFGLNHDTHDGRMADVVLVAAGAAPRTATDQIDPLPLGKAFGRNTAVNAHAMAGGDLNGDGRTDFVVGDWGHSTCSECMPYFLIQQPGGRWSVVQDSFLNDITRHQPLVNAGVGENYNLLVDMHLADLNGDRLDDLVVGWGHGSSYSWVFFNQGNGKFSREAGHALPRPSFGVDNSIHLRTWSLDINRDGALDLVINHSRFVPYYGGYAFQFLINDGKGNFRDETFSRLRSMPENEAPNQHLYWSMNYQFVDMNGDGQPDLIGSDFFQPNGFPSQVRLWINRGGTFSEVPVETPPGWRGKTLFWADFGSGKMGTLAFHTSWTDGTGSGTRVWYTYYELEGAIP